MRTGHRPAWRRRPQSRAARIAVPLAIPMALGLTLGAVLAFTGGPSSTTIQQAATGATASPSASGSASASAVASAAPTATAAAPAAAAAANVSCDIVVPANPLTAQGLSTPYQLTGPNGMTPAASGCTMANFANLGAFVQATILDPATGALSVYEPLVITKGTTAAVPPVVPTLPAGAVVTIDFGFNGTNLTQVGATRNALRQGNCVNGLNGSIFGQVSFCNGTQFFRAAAQAEAQGKLTIPAAGTATQIAGMTCPTTRSFSMIDQDQSDNVTTTYLLNGNGQTAQFNAANAAAMTGARRRSTTAATTSCSTASSTRPSAARRSRRRTCSRPPAPWAPRRRWTNCPRPRMQAAPIALVPENDEMVLVNNAFSATKTNLYRSNVGQPPISNANNAADSPQNYCQNMVNVQTPFLANNQTLLATGATPGARDRATTCSRSWPTG